MSAARTLLHVFITFAVVLHGAWMAAMPIAHAAPLIEAPMLEAEHSDAAHASHGSHADHAAHAHHDPLALLASAPTSCSEAEHQDGVHGSDKAQAHPLHHHDAAGHEGHDGGHDHNMSGCECTLCKISGLAAVETHLQLSASIHRDARPRIHPAQQVRVTTGPPVGLRAPPVHL